MTEPVFDWDFSPLGDRILADALSRACPACSAPVGEPCSGLDGDAVHSARAHLAREVIAKAETYIEWLPDIPPAPRAPDPPPPPRAFEEAPDWFSAFLTALLLAGTAGVGWVIFSLISHD